MIEAIQVILNLRAACEFRILWAERGGQLRAWPLLKRHEPQSVLRRSGDEWRPRVYLGTFKREGGPQVSLEANHVGLRGARERETASVSMGWGKTRKGTLRGLPRFGQKLV